MDNSQSSDCFLESEDISFVSPVPMDTISYQSLVASTKQALSSGVEREVQKSSFFTYFTTLLDDCYTSINQTFEHISCLLSEKEICLNKLTEYLNDAVSLLQMFSDFIKTVIESASMTCCSMKSFPTITGQIIIIVFIHCKDSESLYGQKLTSVEKQLKELFRNCHELQLTYLMVLEKHFIFDLTEKEDRGILVEALDINLKIGEIVQSLDVKTMAEQWKAFTMLCEKYSTIVSETNLFQDCTQILCYLISDNIKTALEMNQDDKVIIRSLKVASFTIKILLKTCTIFKDAARRVYSDIVDLMFFMQTTCHLGSNAIKPQFTTLIHTSILTPSECLVKELLSDEMFVHSLLNYDLESITKDTLLGFILTLTSAMKCLSLDIGKKTAAKIQCIDCVYSVLRYSHIWINLDIRLKSEPDQSGSHGIFEHLLIHTAALALTLNNDEYSVLEKNMAKAILDTESCCALFSANVWMIMARHVNSQLLFNQLIWLCTMYKKLEKLQMFYISPQKIHLSYTISGLFEVMDNEDKMKICKQFRIHDDDNISIWTALRVNNSPDDVRSADGVVFEKLKMQFQSFNSSKSQEEIDRLIKLMNLAATCPFTNIRGIEDFVLKAWLKICPKYFTIQDIDDSTVWFYDYLQALHTLTESLWLRLSEKSAYLIKIQHVISSLIQQCGVDIKLLLANMFCKLATCALSNNKIVNTNFTEAFSCLLQDSDDIVRNKILALLTKYKHDRNLDHILSNIEDRSFQETWCNVKNGRCNETKELLKMDYKYSHKCFESRNVIELSSSSSVANIKNTDSANFDFADIENLFDKDSECEQPVPKKIKLNVSEAETIIGRLETDVSLLCKVKENLFTPECRHRIQNVCDKLSNIIHSS